MIYVNKGFAVFDLKAIFRIYLIELYLMHENKKYTELLLPRISAQKRMQSYNSNIRALYNCLTNYSKTLPSDLMVGSGTGFR